MNILSIGNSFSQDAQRYLHALAEGHGMDIRCVNLFIGGCSLAKHWENLKQDAALYQYQLNGQAVDQDGNPRLVSIREALEEGAWDVITLQQASHDSGEYDTYQPALSELARAVRRRLPEARLMLHETWAYETDSTHDAFPRYGNSQAVMYARLKSAYAQAAAEIGVPLIRAGDVIQALRALPAFDYPQGGISLCRDGFHMSLTYGRYTLAAVWLATLTGKAVRPCAFVPEGCEERLLAVICDTVNTVVLA